MGIRLLDGLPEERFDFTKFRARTSDGETFTVHSARGSLQSFWYIRRAKARGKSGDIQAPLVST
jgi:hypothetical protein